MDQITISHEDAQELYILIEAYRSLFHRSATLKELNSDKFTLSWGQETLTIQSKSVTPTSPEVGVIVGDTNLS